MAKYVSDYHSVCHLPHLVSPHPTLPYLTLHILPYILHYSAVALQYLTFTCLILPYLWNCWRTITLLCSLHLTFPHFNPHFIFALNYNITLNYHAMPYSTVLHFTSNRWNKAAILVTWVEVDPSGGQPLGNDEYVGVLDVGRSLHPLKQFDFEQSRTELDKLDGRWIRKTSLAAQTVLVIALLEYVAHHLHTHTHARSYK